MTDRPLASKIILVTRAKEQAQDLTKLVEAKGGTTIEVPLIAFQSLQTPEIKTAIHTINDYQWLIFTSSNGVRFFMEQYELLQQTWKLPKHLKIAVVGQKTERTLAKYHLQADLCPDEFVAEGLIEELKGQIRNNERVLIARGNLGRDILVQQLSRIGAQVDDVTVYKTVVPEAANQLEQVLNHSIDYITFTSSSTVHHFMQIIRQANIQIQAKIACIGPIAAKTVQDYGLTVDVMPTTYTIDHLVEEIIADTKENHS
ncbi:uroporphyrinogen-III synthase [Halalkalibacter akibai]|uniref:Uroporphyrinogen-III synthase n=1 Tax=Halalkalibacter akibai (strain ATCC 43226 / DSM 21942 / CIP 109018 / JCM 9157 / 1139) TaxID=1236973 RepID=W4QUE2_HALA3|nr:uroporphyrinogen-III synthase [Halalkalibacter akibai]GAE34929.1 uroporphyrinogen-III methyltransferase [Halalkalibacter akibai JCM 9157]